MDVKYIPSDWKKMRDGIGDLIGLGRWGKGMIDSLKDVSDNLEDAEADIAKYDSDGVISFHHTSLKSKYQSLYEDFQVLHRFTGKVGDIIDRTIDQPFYEDMDAFVEAMRDLTISNYKTKNRIGAVDTQFVYAGYGERQKFEVPKTEVSIDDLFNGDNYYGKQMKLEYEAWKELNPDQDFTQEQYQQAAVNTRAFEYESIRNRQENKEFWTQIGALVVIVGATLICPPAGMALGAAYGAMELSSAVSGKDWVSGRELGTGERVFRGVLAPLDIVPGVSGLTKFSGTVRLAHAGENIGHLGIGIKGSFKQGVMHIDNMVKTAGQQSVTRLRSASSAAKDAANVVKNKLAKDIIEVGKAADTAVTHVRNNFSPRTLLEPEYAGVGKVATSAENTHAIENSLAGMVSKIKGINIEGVAKVTGKVSNEVSDIKTFVDKGQHFTNGRKNRLKPNIRYQTGEYDYFYETDHLGRISKFETENLQLTKREDRLSHSKNTLGKVKGQDHAGHLAGDRFGGSPKLDNLVSQLSDVNLKQYKKIEDEWATALKETPPKEVTVDVEITYTGDELRPEKFIVNYSIDGEWGFKILKN
ncbi:DNA/RNA non-specific endonuclease [Neobacillus mesonae]|uniref:DNA/RNA non-specific endonuclease n=1 Tax=Neobacillus mesonae TaxID=1193713 RepID=UPI002E236EB3|nr:DNA/RNA non-specific endonuclease [Neobacillus mesonae]